MYYIHFLTRIYASHHIAKVFARAFTDYNYTRTYVTKVVYINFPGVVHKRMCKRNKNSKIKKYIWKLSWWGATQRIHGPAQLRISTSWNGKLVTCNSARSGLMKKKSFVLYKIIYIFFCTTRILLQHTNIVIRVHKRV